MAGVVDTVKGYYKGIKDWGDQSVQDSKAIAEKGKNIQQYKDAYEPKTEAKAEPTPKEAAPAKRDTRDTEKYIQGIMDKENARKLKTKTATGHKTGKKRSAKREMKR